MATEGVHIRHFKYNEMTGNKIANYHVLFHDYIHALLS